MRKRRLKRLAAAFLSCIMMVSCLMVNVYAESDLEEIIVPSYHTTTETETEVSATSQVLVRGAYLASGTVKLGVNGGGSINIYGSTSDTQCMRYALPEYLFGEIDEWNFMVSL